MKKKVKILSYVVLGIVVTAVIYIMINHLGLVEELDFGAGAYYYADIPDFEKYLSNTVYSNTIPSWVIYLLFFLWGGIMYKVWRFIDKQ